CNCNCTANCNFTANCNCTANCNFTANCNGRAALAGEGSPGEARPGPHGSAAPEFATGHGAACTAAAAGVCDATPAVAGSGDERRAGPAAHRAACTAAAAGVCDATPAVAGVEHEAARPHGAAGGATTPAAGGSRGTPRLGDAAVARGDSD